MFKWGCVHICMYVGVGITHEYMMLVCSYEESQRDQIYNRWTCGVDGVNYWAYTNHEDGPQDPHEIPHVVVLLIVLVNQLLQIVHHSHSQCFATCSYGIVCLKICWCSCESRKITGIVAMIDFCMAILIWLRCWYLVGQK